MECQDFWEIAKEMKTWGSSLAARLVLWFFKVSGVNPLYLLLFCLQSQGNPSILLMEKPRNRHIEWRLEDAMGKVFSKIYI